MSIKMEDIHFSYNDKKIFEAFNFYYKESGIVIVSGLNGTGKTTLLKLMAGLIQPDKGFIETYKTSQIGYVPDKPVLWENFSVNEQLKMMADLYSVEISPKIWELLSKLEMNKLLDVEIKKLSNGYKRKLNFLLSILHDPELLLLDEVFNGLDENSIEVLIRFLQSFSKTHQIVMTTNRGDILSHQFDRRISLKGVV